MAARGAELGVRSWRGGGKRGLVVVRRVQRQSDLRHEARGGREGVNGGTWRSGKRRRQEHRPARRQAGGALGEALGGINPKLVK